MKDTIILYYPKTHHERNYSYSWIPYSILSLAGNLKVAGYNVVLIDANENDDINNINIDYTKVLLVGISLMIGKQLDDGISFASTIKRKYNIPILAGGPFPTLLPQLALDCSVIDFIIRGPGEKLIVELANALKNGSAINKKIGFRNGNITNIGIVENILDEFDIAPYNFNLINTPRYVRNDPNISSLLFSN